MIKRKFKAHPIGYFHIDIAEVRSAMGKLYLFVAINEPRSSPSPSCTRKPRGVSRPTSYGT